jgi:hydrogenase maturation protease
MAESPELARARVVVLGWGNATRGDDAIGPLLMERVERLDLPHVATVVDYQLQIEHALDLVERDLVLFVDSGFETPAPFFFVETAARRGMTHASHGLQPEAVLDVYRQVTGKTPPSAFVLCVRGENFDLIESTSPLAAQRLELAWEFLHARLEAPDIAAWRKAIVAGR